MVDLEVKELIPTNLLSLFGIIQKIKTKGTSGDKLLDFAATSDWSGIIRENCNPENDINIQKVDSALIVKIEGETKVKAIYDHLKALDEALKDYKGPVFILNKGSDMFVSKKGGFPDEAREFSYSQSYIGMHAGERLVIDKQGDMNFYVSIPIRNGYCRAIISRSFLARDEGIDFEKVNLDMDTIMSGINPEITNTNSKGGVYIGDEKVLEAANVYFKYNLGKEEYKSVSGLINKLRRT